MAWTSCRVINKVCTQNVLPFIMRGCRNYHCKGSNQFFPNNSQCILSLSTGNIFLPKGKCVLIDDKNHRLSIIQMCWQAASLFCYCRLFFPRILFVPFENLSSKYFSGIEFNFLQKTVNRNVMLRFS